MQQPCLQRRHHRPLERHVALLGALAMQARQTGGPAQLQGMDVQPRDFLAARARVRPGVGEGCGGVLRDVLVGRRRGLDAGFAALARLPEPRRADIAEGRGLCQLTWACGASSLAERSVLGVPMRLSEG